MKISKLVKVQYIIARGVDLYIYAFANYIYADGFVLSYQVEAYNTERNVDLYAYRHFNEYRDYVKVSFPAVTPKFEFLNCVTQ